MLVGGGAGIILVNFHSRGYCFKAGINPWLYRARAMGWGCLFSRAKKRARGDENLPMIRRIWMFAGKSGTTTMLRTFYWKRGSREEEEAVDEIRIGANLRIEPGRNRKLLENWENFTQLG